MTRIAFYIRDARRDIGLQGTGVSGFRMQDPGSWASGVGCCVEGLGFRV